MTICPDGTIYLAMIRNNLRGGGSSLFEVNPNDGSLFEIGPLDVPGLIEAIACDASGVLYGVNSFFDIRSPPDTHLYRIDRNDACPTDLGSLGILFMQGDIDFAPDGLLYGINDGDDELRAEGTEADDERGSLPASGPIYRIDVSDPGGFQVTSTMPGGHESLSVLPNPEGLAIPTVSQLGLAAFALLIALIAAARLRAGT